MALGLLGGASEPKLLRVRVHHHWIVGRIVRVVVIRVRQQVRAILHPTSPPCARLVRLSKPTPLCVSLTFIGKLVEVLDLVRCFVIHLSALARKHLPLS